MNKAETALASPEHSLSQFQDSVGESDTFLKAVAARSSPSYPASFVVSGSVIGGRYEVQEKLGRGGNGEVFRAIDRGTGAAVGLKVLRLGSAESVARACREVASLRLLRLPGVVRLIDEGVAEGVPFLVMDYVAGAPFPGRSASVENSGNDWTTVQRPLLSLLETLQRVHAAGFVHRDLKPENVLVGEDFRPILLDFGIAQTASGFASITQAGTVIGTPAFLAPEQISGGTLTAQTDLYAVGVMVFLALTGRFPHDSSSFSALVDVRLHNPAPPLALWAKDIPAHVANAVDWLLATHPKDRPLSAREAFELFSDEPRAQDSVPKQRAPRELWALHEAAVKLDEPALKSWFSGPDRVLHLREDAAHLLFERTGGDPVAARNEVERWLSMGLVHRDGSTLRMDRASILHLQLTGPAASVVDELWTKPRGSPGRFRYLLSKEGSEAAEETAREALVSAELLTNQGAPEVAAAHLREGLFALRRAGAPAQATLALVFSAMVDVAFAEGNPPALDRVLYELCRPETACPLTFPLTHLVRAALAADGWAERTHILAEEVPHFESVRLELLRQGVRVQAARRISLDQEEKTLAEVFQWALSLPDNGSGDKARALASHATWLGRLRYCQNQFEESARLHDRAVALCQFAPVRLSALVFGGGAWLEAFAFENAKNRADEARKLAAELRHAHIELLAENLLRMVAYRTGKTDGKPPDAELLEIAPRLGSAYCEGAVFVTEAAVAYRNGDVQSVHSLSETARVAFGNAGHPIGTVLSQCLWVRSGGSLTSAEISALVERARQCPVPTVGLQCLALLAEGGCSVLVVSDELRNKAHSIPMAHWDQRLDVLTVNEALSTLACGPAK